MLERRRVRDGRVERADDPHRRVERLERLLLDDRGDALADAAGARVFVDDQHAAAVAGDAEDGVAVERRERAQVEHRRLDAVGGQPLGDAHRDVDVGAVGDDREVIAGAAQRRAADRQRRRRRVVQAPA